MSEQENLKLARSSFDCWNAHDPERYVMLLEEKHVIESDTIPATMTGREAGREFMKTYVSAFPDLHFQIDQMLASGDFVVTQYTATGTHRGDLMGIPATHRRATVRGCTVAEIRNGKLTHDWIYWDTGTLLKQLGVLPNPK
jgi:steroid delta-isomerase-like uncharacterized protein